MKPITVTQYCDKWQVAVKKVMNLCVPKIPRHVLTRPENVRVSRTLSLGVSCLINVQVN